MSAIASIVTEADLKPEVNFFERSLTVAKEAMQETKKGATTVFSKIEEVVKPKEELVEDLEKEVEEISRDIVRELIDGLEVKEEEEPKPEAQVKEVKEEEEPEPEAQVKEVVEEEPEPEAQVKEVVEEEPVSEVLVSEVTTEA